MATKTEERRERNAAIERGLDFVYRTSNKQKHFANYGAFMICCFAFVGATARNQKLRRIGRDRAQQLLRRWSQMHPILPADLSSDLLHAFVVVRYAQSRIGIRDSAGASAIRAAASRFSAADLLGFDPAKEPPPNDLPYQCDCTFQNQRGRKACKQCRRRLRIQSRYRVWMEALANTYVAERSGILFGARYAEVLRWLPSMRPYPKAGEHDEETVRAAIYAVTHVVYTLNDYNTFKLSPRLLPQEFAYLKTNVRDACTRHDTELLGELLDSLQALGLTAKDPLIQNGTRYLMQEQNNDGSWGDPREQNIRTRCHTTWTAIDGLRAYAWRGVRLSM
ncbi:MAG TPA: hypothetical protein VGO56_19350 [Pyrinomonadaceae bacterium]|nr:hypothetical protein [Pyrinomonadaceae bacterium]